MKKIKGIATLALVGLVGLGLAGCTDEGITTSTPPNTTEKPTTPTPPTTPDKVEVEKITLMKGQRIFTVGESWTLGDLEITAHMTDGSTKDVTSSATIDHSAVKLDTPGTYQVNVSYEGNQTSYKVTVVAEEEAGLLVATENAKTKYIIGETFIADGITVTKKDVDGSQETVTDYTVKIYKDELCTEEVTGAFTETGTYYALVVAGDLSAKYEVTVTKEQYTVNTSINFDNSVGQVFTSDTIIYNDEIGKNTIKAYASDSKKLEFEANKAEFDNGKVFNTRLKLGGSPLANGATTITVDKNGDPIEKRVLRLDLSHDANVRIYGRSSSSDARNLIVTDLKAFTEKYETVSAAISKEFTMKAGTYYIFSENKGINIYGIDINYTVDKDNVEFSDLTLDTANLPETFEVNQPVDLSGLVVTVNSNYGSTDTLTPNDYKVTDKDGKEVSKFTTPGTYTLTVTFGTLTKNFDIQVQDPNAIIEKLEITTQADKLVYRPNEAFTLDKLVLIATDNYGITSTIEWTDPALTYRILSGAEDVTANFDKLTKGQYKVELTYKGVSVSYEITKLEEKDAYFNNPTNLNVPVGSVNVDKTGAGYVITYTDGTDKDYSSYNTTILWSVEGFDFKFYADETLMTEKTVQELATEVGTKFYATMTYNSKTSDTITFTVTEQITSQVLDVTQEAPTADKTKITSFNNSFFNVVGNIIIRTNSGTPKAYELEKRSGGGITFATTSKCTVTFVVLSTGDTNGSFMLLKDAYGNEIDNNEGLFGVYGRTDTTVTYTLEAGTYTFYAQANKSFADYKDTDKITFPGGATNDFKGVTGRGIQVKSVTVEFTK